MLTALGLVAVVALILANGYFVAGEFAYVAARRTRLEDRAQAGDRGAVRALGVLKRLSFMLSGAQLGITATSLVVGYIAEPTLGRVLTPVVALAGVPPAAAAGLALTIGFVLATAAQMVFGELAPKNLAIAKPEPFAIALARTTSWYLRLAGPVIQLFDGAANRLLRALGIEPVEELEGAVTPEELGVIIEESGRHGGLTPNQTALLARALEFRALRASDAMVPRPQVMTVSAHATCDELRRLALDSGHSRFVVVGDRGLDDVRGIVHAKDLLSLDPQRRATAPIAQLMAPACAVPESATLPRLLAELRDARTTLAVVVDEYGGTAGIVTLEDVVEELVGEIRDEYDPAEPVVEALPDGSYLLPGNWRLDETERDTGVALPAGDYDTVSGLIMARLGHLPAVGDTVDVGSAELRVEALAGLAVGRVRLWPRGQEEE